jgi:hypothetical protein
MYLVNKSRQRNDKKFLCLLLLRNNKIFYALEFDKDMRTAILYHVFDHF